MQKLEEYLKALQDEQRKLDAFKRELPCCMQLLTEAIERARQQLEGTQAKAAAAPFGARAPSLQLGRASPEPPATSAAHDVARPGDHSRGGIAEPTPGPASPLMRAQEFLPMPPSSAAWDRAQWRPELASAKEGAADQAKISEPTAERPSARPAWMVPSPAWIPPLDGQAAAANEHLKEERPEPYGPPARPGALPSVEHAGLYQSPGTKAVLVGSQRPTGAFLPFTRDRDRQVAGTGIGASGGGGSSTTTRDNFSSPPSGSADHILHLPRTDLALRLSPSGGLHLGVGSGADSGTGTGMAAGAGMGGGAGAASRGMSLEAGQGAGAGGAEPGGGGAGAYRGRMQVPSSPEERGRGGQLGGGGVRSRSQDSDLHSGGGGDPRDVGAYQTGGGGGAGGHSGGSSGARKARRCWSPELHKRFVSALGRLGGPQVATPKQIRELMKVDGLTNDEVKSHLQKYRLHTRRPSPVPHATAAAAAAAAQPQPQLVVLGGMWVPPTYAAVTSGAQHQSPSGYDLAAPTSGPHSLFGGGPQTAYPLQLPTCHKYGQVAAPHPGSRERAPGSEIDLERSPQQTRTAVHSPPARGLYLTPSPRYSSRERDEARIRARPEGGAARDGGDGRAAERRPSPLEAALDYKAPNLDMTLGSRGEYTPPRLKQDEPCEARGAPEGRGGHELAVRRASNGQQPAVRP
eukprot:jgi/Mesen1/2781/ME000170S01887